LTAIAAAILQMNERRTAVLASCIAMGAAQATQGEQA